MLQIQANAQAEEESALQAENLVQANRQKARSDSLNILLTGQVSRADSLLIVARDANDQYAQQVRIANSALGYAEGARAGLEEQLSRADSLTAVALAANMDLAAQIARADSLQVVTESTLEEVSQARLETLTLGLANAARRQVRLRNPVLGSLLARQAYLFSLRGEGKYADAIYDALVDALNAVSPSGEDPAGGPGIIGVLESPVRTVAISTDERWMAAGQENGEIMLISNGENVARLSRSLNGHLGAVRDIVFDPTGDLLASAGDDGSILLWEMDENSTAHSELGRHDGSVWALAFAPDGRSLVSAGADQTVRIWDVSERTESPVFQIENASRVRAVAYSPDGRTVVFGDEEGLIHLWDGTGSRPSSRPSGQGRLHALVFHPDGSYFVSGGDSTTVKQWNLTPESPIPEAGFELHGHEGSVNALAISGDGVLLASGSSDHSIQAWDTGRTDAASLILQDHTRWVWSLAMNSDGSRIISGGADRSLRLWNLKLDELAARVCDYVGGQELATYEWDQYVGADFDYDSEYLPCGAPAITGNSTSDTAPGTTNE